MRILNLFLILIVFLNSCQSNQKELFDLNLMSKEWIQLTEKEGEFIIYTSCDYGNGLLTLSKNGSKFELLLHGQQEDSAFEVLESTKIKDTLFLETLWKEGNKKQTFKFFWINQQKEIGKWSTVYENGVTSENLFVLKEKQSNFEVVNQPSHECWGEECDEIESEVVAIDQPIATIRNIVEQYIEYQESTDSRENLQAMTKSIEALEIVKNPKDIALLIQVWMYYDPTDFPTRDLVFKVLKKNASLSSNVIRDRMKNKEEWENESSAPFSELEPLLKTLKNE